ncbi:MAG: hypothetical protein EAZ40_02620 [Rhodobacterales bacterium]|nr:MAG: hypothetical protein EAZ40_02620 [Rhodobacterales bacterium]
MRGAIGLVVVGATVLAAGALVVLRPQMVEGFLPPVAISALTGLGASGLRDADATPADFLVDSPEGLLATGPIAAVDGNRPVFIDAVVSGYTTRISADIPAEITTIRPILGCMPTPPQPGTMVGHASAGTSGLALALSTYNDSHLAAAVQTFVDRYRRLGPDMTYEAGGPPYEAYDIAVTETEAPVYLVLETGAGNRMWNLHLAPGARIERVILLGGDQAGIANLDPVVPVEVILNDGLATCGIQPVHDLNPGHQLVQIAQGSLRDPALSRQDAETQLAALRDAADAYDVWFRDSFGVLAGESRIGFDAGTISVIGPVPTGAEPKAAYDPIAGARIRTTQDQFFEIKGQVAEGQDFTARVRTIATEFALGNLATLSQGVDF